MLRCLLLSLVLCAVPWMAHTQQNAHSISLDLASPVVERTVDPGTPLVLAITNRLPFVRYTYSVQRITIPIPALERIPGTGRFPGPAVMQDPCVAEIESFWQTLRAQTQETQLRDTARVLIARSQACSGRLQSIYDRNTVEHIDGTFTLERGEQLVVTVSRAAQNETATWRFVLSTGARGEWRTSYGFTFVPRGDHEYFTKQLTDDPTKFVITRKRETDESGLDESFQFLPSVLFSWLPGSQRNRQWMTGLTGGVGYNFDRLAVFGGVGWTYNENLMLTAGVSMHQKQRLNGIYSRGDTVTGNRTAEELQVPRFRPSVYIGISFRLDNNPFEEPSEPNTDGTRPEPTPENAARKPEGGDEEPEEPEVEGAATEHVFEFSELEAGVTEFDGLKVESVDSTAETITVTFAGPPKNVTGEWRGFGDGTLCIEPSAESGKSLPRPKDVALRFVCPRESDELTRFAEEHDINTTVTMKLSDYKVLYNRKDPSKTTFEATYVPE